ncbi:MAG: arginine--tRNA ligase [Deltaproteobacteria bacterium]|jgi:arginyl-tRNA synthetase|nr:arginine--tRNA ligase [Deltaproteobacteria bacterium]
MKEMMRTKLDAALKSLARKRGWTASLDLGGYALEEPRDPAFGHLAANAAMTLAKAVGLKPRELAELIAAEIDDPEGFIESTSVEGPGFINFRLSIKWWARILRNVRLAGADYGRGAPDGRRVQVESVSANPTGPLHVGHGRGAALGDALARLLAFLGHEVEREYYVNDAGRQMRVLGGSTLHRLRELEGRTEPEPAEFYRGEYVRDLARELRPRLPADFGQRPQDEQTALLSELSGQAILAGIKADLAAFRAGHDVWFAESSLYADGLVEEAFAELDKAGRLYRQDGALWFKTTDLGDDRDRVLVKSSGEKTYFAADLAYHQHKFRRGFDLVVDVWGADHHGYIPRMKAAVEALGARRDQLAVVLVQLVNLLRDGKPAQMSTRAGEFVTLKELVDEVGVDAARFIFLTRSCDSTLDFDLELAKAKTRDNPVFYVQYVCARASSVLAKASVDGPPADLELLNTPEELELVKHLAGFPETLRAAAKRLEPCLLASWLTGLAKLFHQYYGLQRLVDEDKPALTSARLELVAAVRQTASIGLNLLGVTAPEKM